MCIIVGANIFNSNHQLFIYIFSADNPNNRRTYEFATSTKEDKFPEISPGVYVTLCGDAKRCQEMVEYVHMELQDIIYMWLTPAFTSVLRTVSHFFWIVSPWNREQDKECTVHIFHWLPQKNVCALTLKKLVCNLNYYLYGIVLVIFFPSYRITKFLLLDIRAFCHLFSLRVQVQTIIWRRLLGGVYCIWI